MAISGEIVRVKVLAVDRYPSSEKNRAYYAEKEALDVENEGGQRYKLTRFRKKSENRIAVGCVYQGEQVQSKDPAKYPIDTLENVEYVDGGFDGIVSENWPVAAVDDEQDARQKSILVQSDMKTAATLTLNWERDWDGFIELYYKVKAFREGEEAK